MEYNCIKVEVRETGIALLTISRPEALNALNIQALREFCSALDALAEDRGVRGLILMGEGRAFVSGADLKEVSSPREGASEFYGERFMDFLGLVETAFNKLAHFPRPTVAAVNGYALGGGCEFALCCDFRIAGTEAVFGFPETGIGLSPAFGGTQRLPRLIGIPRAKELMFSGRKVRQEEAASIGLADFCAQPDTLISSAEELLGRFLNRGPIAIKYIKQCIDRGMEIPLEEGLQYEKSLGALCHLSGNGAEGILSFQEKRPPVFKNR